MVGRHEEIKVLTNLLSTQEAELVSVLGRRRVGKTYLLRETFKDHMAFEFIGVQGGSRTEQLNAFTFSLQQTFGKKAVPNIIPSWLAAFQILIELLSAKPFTKKQVVFIDELPWIAGKKSDFLKGFGFFWNNWASKQKIVVAVCGSAASWMIKHVIQNTGGLHNRVTRQIHLQPFTCSETKAYLHERGLKFNDEQITELYMTFGGIPYYLKLIDKSKSVAQVVNTLCFKDNAALKNEFENLYAALFTHHQSYISVIKACYSTWKGVSQNDIIKLTGIASGGTLTRMLSELELSGFIISTPPFTNAKKETLYRLIDEFSVFYLKFMDGKKTSDWNLISQSQPFKLWQGYAFENFCFRHIQSIKQQLGIAAVISQQYAYQIKSHQLIGNHQIDLLIDRNDQCINLCEVKYHHKPFIITKQYAEILRLRMQHFGWESGTKKTVFLTFITRHGIVTQAGVETLVDSEVLLKDFY
ncbi:MAG: ATP-binding protein [Bacteroidetes bacterium]|nr:MAG: ATP-binding protein [Bacteroidota bacterium]